MATTPRTTQIVIRIRVRWWLRWYIAGVAMTSILTGLDPDVSKVARWIARGLVFEVVQR